MLLGLWLILEVSSLSVARVLHKTLHVPVLMYRSETMIWKEKERSRNMMVQRDKIRCLSGIRRMDSLKIRDTRVVWSG